MTTEVLGKIAAGALVFGAAVLNVVKVFLEHQLSKKKQQNAKDQEPPK